VAAFDVAPRAMKRTPFYSLKRPLQERFIAATKGLTVPAALAHQPLRLRFPVLWTAASAASLIAFFLVLGVGYGKLESSLALVPGWMFAVYAVLLAIAIWCAVQAWAQYQRQQRSPFLLGVYLFPGVLMDARTPVLDSYSLTDGATSSAEGSNLSVRVGGKTWVFGMASDAEARQLKEQLDDALRDAANAGAEFHRFDPLAEPRYSSPLTSRERISPFAPKWVKWSPVIAALVAAIVAPAAGATRNLLSERRMYSVAVERNTSASYRDYLARVGETKRPDVREVRLPTAELNELKASGDLAALERWALENEDSKIKLAIDTVLRQELLNELVSVARKENLGAVARFAEEHPKHALVETEIKNVRKKLTRRAYQEYADKYSTKTEGSDAAIDALLAHIAEHDATLEVRFQRIVTEKVNRADQVVRNSKYYAPAMLPSQYFDAKASRQREDDLYANFERRFRTAFSADVVDLKRGEAIEPGQKAPPNPSKPLLLISHTITMGHGIGNTHPNGIFVGVGFQFEAQLFVPDAEKPLKLRYSTWRMPDLTKLREGKLTIPQVYEQMADVAFEAFDKRFTDWLVRPPAEK
jgi:hypothetical protein